MTYEAIPWREVLDVDDDPVSASVAVYMRIIEQTQKWPAEVVVR